MHKSRIINEIDTEMADENLVWISDGKFECRCPFEAGTPVRVQVDFDDVEITDDEEDGVIGATVVSSIYKGSYYQCIVRTDDYYDFFVDTDDDWLKGDRVGIRIAPEKIIIEKREVTDGDAPAEPPAAVPDQTVDESAPADAADADAAPEQAETVLTDDKNNDAEVTE